MVNRVVLIVLFFIGVFLFFLNPERLTKVTETIGVIVLGLTGIFYGVARYAAHLMNGGDHGNTN